MTLKELLGAWAEQDHRYAYRKSGPSFVAVSETEQESIRSWRRREANELAGDERSIALLELSRWVPPVRYIPR